MLWPPCGITPQQQKNVNMQNRLISFPRSSAQKRAACVHKSTACYTKCDLSADGVHGVLLIFASGVNEASFGQKVFFYLIHSSLEKKGLELLEHLSSGGFNRRVCTSKSSTQFIWILPKPLPNQQTRRADSRRGLLALIPANLQCLYYQTGLDWYLCVTSPTYTGSTLNF